MSYYFYCLTKETLMEPIEQRLIIDMHPLAWMVEILRKGIYEKVTPIWWTEMDVDTPEIREAFQLRPTAMQLANQDLKPKVSMWILFNGETPTSCSGELKDFQSMIVDGQLPEGYTLRQFVEI